jgi:NAD-dependent deacetylase sirtuin 2
MDLTYLSFPTGSFGGAHCINCHASMSIDDVKAAIVAEQIPRCASCNGYVKPDIVFFGESLPKRYFELSMSDLPRADLLLVLGTSLKVQPFASLIDHVDDKCPRVLINREAVGLASGDGDQDIFHFGSRGGFVFDGPTAYRDIFCEGDVQDSVLQLVKLCGWKDELQELMDEFDKKNKKPEAVTSSTTTTATTTTTTSSSSSSSSSTSSAAASTTAVAIKREQEKAAENEHSESEAEESRQ